jgi:hypothetical protein
MVLFVTIECTICRKSLGNWSQYLIDKMPAVNKGSIDLVE